MEETSKNIDNAAKAAAEENEERRESVAPLQKSAVTTISSKINQRSPSLIKTNLILPIDSNIYQYPNGFTNVNGTLSPNRILISDNKSRSLSNLENTPPLSPAQRSISPLITQQHTHRWK